MNRLFNKQTAHGAGFFCPSQACLLLNVLQNQITIGKIVGKMPIGAHAPETGEAIRFDEDLLIQVIAQVAGEMREACLA